MMTEVEQLEEELKWAKEAAAVAEAQNQGHFGNSLIEAQAEQIPAEYQYLCDIEASVLEQRIERLSRDLEHARDGWSE